MRIPTADGEYQLCLYANNRDDKEHLALVMGEVAGKKDWLVRYIPNASPGMCWARDDATAASSCSAPCR